MQTSFRKNTESNSRKKKQKGLIIHRNKEIKFNTIFGKLKIRAPYLWLQGIDSLNPIIDNMKIYHNGRSEAVNRALSDFGIEESFVTAAIRFKDHYYYDIGLSEELKRQFSTMQFILDKSHFRDHLYDTAEALGIKKEDRAAWVNPIVKATSDGKIGAVLKELEDDSKSNQNDRRSWLIGYIKRFYDALDYGSFKSKGYPIGSGEIESAHKSIPQKRLKLPGASWSADSINPILSLRILRANSWWEDFWEQRTQVLFATLSGVKFFNYFKLIGGFTFIQLKGNRFALLDFIGFFEA